MEGCHSTPAGLAVHPLARHADTLAVFHAAGSAAAGACAQFTVHSEHTGIRLEISSARFGRTFIA